MSLSEYQKLVIMGTDTEFLPARNVPEAWDNLTKEVCYIESYSDFTARSEHSECIMDGVYKGMVCDYVHDKAICCGGEFGTNVQMSLLQNDCGYLEGSTWTKMEDLPEALEFPSSAPVTINGTNYWLVSGGGSKS